ncbi:hypothetical protein Pfo_017922 [Paulownia fortunei]|nr:hypothetical protein Pfo_017922 [Paulownia fortunei]
MEKKTREREVREGGGNLVKFLNENHTVHVSSVTKIISNRINALFVYLVDVDLSKFVTLPSKIGWFANFKRERKRKYEEVWVATYSSTPAEKQPTKPPLPTPIGCDEDDDDNVERDIPRQAYKNKYHKDVKEQHKKALEEDPSVLDYDGVYDKMKEKQVRPIEQDRQDRRPRYIRALIDKAKQQEKEHELTYERKLAKERSKDERLYADKDKFVTSACEKKLAERAKWLEKVTKKKKTDLSDFYFNLAKNVAFGATEDDLRKPEKQPEEVVAHSESSRLGKRHQDETAVSLSPKEKSDRAYGKPMSDASTQDQTANKPSASDQQTET